MFHRQNKSVREIARLTSLSRNTIIDVSVNQGSAIAHAAVAPIALGRAWPGGLDLARPVVHRVHHHRVTPSMCTPSVGLPLRANATSAGRLPSNSIWPAR